MKCFVAVSRLLKIKNSGTLMIYHFHFRGAYEGKMIKGISLEMQENELFECGEDYLLYLAFVGFENDHIRAKLIKAKPLKDLSA